MSPESAEVMRNYALIQIGLSWQDLEVIPYEKAHELLILHEEIIKKENEDSKK